MDYRRGRLITGRLVSGILRNAQAAYYSDLTFTEAVKAVIIANAIYIAHTEGNPHTVITLSEHLDIPRATLLRRLSYLTRKGVVVRHEGSHHLEIDPARLETDGAKAVSRSNWQLIIESAKELSRMNSGGADI